MAFPIHATAKRGDVYPLREMMEEVEFQGQFDVDEANKVNITSTAISNQAGQSALIRAAGQAAADCCQLLLEYGADVNFQDSVGRTVCILSM